MNNIQIILFNNFSEHLIPFSMVFLGYSYLVNPPKNINNSFGYRTSMSMKNKKTWEFVHRYIGRVWFKSGLLMLFIAALIFLLQLYVQKYF